MPSGKEAVEMLYANFKRWSVEWEESTGAFSLSYEGIGAVARDIHLKKITGFDEQDYAVCDYDRSAAAGEGGVSVSYSGTRCGRRDFAIRVSLGEEEARLTIDCDGGADFFFTGLLPVGKGENRMAVRLDGKDDILRGALGPASLPGCRGVFAPELDAAATVEGLGDQRIYFDWDKGCFAFDYHTMHRDYSKQITFRVRENLYRNTFHLDYEPLGPTGKKGLPVGWMTWYAVQFRAGEETVLENARFQKEHLAAWGANTVWVDWEWYHRDFTGLEKKGTDMFHPDPDAYPHGLKAVADEIKALGFRPALWIGPTCDAAYNEVLRAHPDVIMAHKPSWCGQYFLDPSHPVFLEEVLPRMIRQAREWGFEAIKWDILPSTASTCDANREKLWNKDLSTRQIMRNAFRRARQLLGDDTYMLYCAGRNERNVDHAVGCFDAMRVGGDIFGWKGFISQCVDRVYDTYMLNGVTIFCDPDNVILREEFNTRQQAVTRATFVSLLGLPFTLGDELPALPQDRLEILRRCMPPLPARPMEIRRIHRQSPQGMLHVRVEKQYGAWDLVNVYNLADEAARYRLNFSSDLQKDAGEAFHAYDFWRNEYLGVLSGEYTFELEPGESRVIALHPPLARPQVISTSRHISQGALEMEELRWDEEAKCLYGLSKVPTEEPYALIVASPASWRPVEGGEEIAPHVWRIAMHPQSTDFAWNIPFERV